MKRLTIFILLLSAAITVNAQGFENFVTAKGNQLMDGDQPMRFFSWNIPNLNYVEDEMEFGRTNPYDLPTEFEMRDAFETVKRMGGTVIRIYTIPVRNTDFPADAVTFVEAPGEFNEEAFKVNDMMLALANEYEIRIIFSLLNNWPWMGGRPNYAAFRGKDKDEFWTDKQLIKDFKKTIDFTINRTNTITGVKYKDDKSILCWETGNELESPYSWTKEIAAYIKKLDKNHLFMDGFFAIDGRTTVMRESLADPNIDIVSSHHYEPNPIKMMKHIDNNLRVVKGQKPYIIGEFGFASTKGMEAVMQKIMANEDIIGGLTWSIRYHHRDGGFYHHSEPLGNGIYKSFHYPGFHSGLVYDEKNFLDMYRRYAFEIRGLEAGVDEAPNAPRLLEITEPHDIRWQGSAGASGYHVQRSESAEGPWQVIGYNVSDAAVKTFANFHDESAQIGKAYYYRVTATNQGGESEPSNVVGPVVYDYQALVDNWVNYGRAFDSKEVELVTGDDRSFKEISSRANGKKGSEMLYQVEGELAGFEVYAFEENPDALSLKIEISGDGERWNEADTKAEVYASKEKNYAYQVPKLYVVSGAKNIRYIRVSFQDVAQIARVELLYK